MLVAQVPQGLGMPFDFGGSSETKVNPRDEKRKLSAQTLRTNLAEKTVDSLSEKEIDQYLKDMGLPVSGSIYARKQRLKGILKISDPELPLTLDSLPKPPKEESRIQIKNAAEGELLSIDQTKGGVMVLRGKVRLQIGKGELAAETVSIDSQRKEIYAEGGIEYNDGPVRVRGEKFLYDFRLSQGVIYDSKASMYPSYFIGEKMKRLDEKRYLMEMGYFTACNAEIPHYSFKASKIVIYEDQTVAAFFITYKVGDWSMFWIPMIYSSSSGNGWTSQVGKNNTQGWFLQNTYQWSDPYPDSVVLPHGYRFRFDIYEKTGQAFQMNAWKVTPWVNYNLDFGYANHKLNEITPGYENRFAMDRMGGIVATNQVDRGELIPNSGLGLRSVGVAYEPWWKTNIMINSKQNDAVKDGTRNIQLRYENQNRVNFDYEYGNRYEPSNTIQGLYTQRDQRFGLIRNMLNWSLDYTESRGGLSVALGARRSLFYQIQAEGYFPTMDMAPVVQIANSSQVGTIPYFNSPLYWDFRFSSSTSKFYAPPVQKQLPFPVPALGSPIDGSRFDPHGRWEDSVLRTQTLTLGEMGFRTSLPWGEYVAITPSAVAGARQNEVNFPGSGNAINSPSNPANMAQRDMLAQDTYQYFRQNHEVRIGVPALFFTTQYRKLDVEKTAMRDPIFGKNRVNEAEFALESYALDDWEVSIRTIRDFRKYASDYEPGPTNQERWYFSVFRISGFVDFLDGFRSRRPTLLEKQRSFYSGVFINNDFVFHTPQNRPLTNNLTLSYKMGGFGLPIVRNFRSFEVGGTWYHVYGRNFLDNYRFFLRTDAKITRTIGMDFELDSRVTEPWRLTNFNMYDYYTLGMTPEMFAHETGINYQRANLSRDIVQGSGAEGSHKRQKAIFNINRFMTTIKMNLHNWEMRLGYSMNLRAFPGGLGGDRQLTFYDQSVFFSVTLTNLQLGQAEGSQMTRARIYRFRKQPLDAVRGQLSGEIQ